MPKLTKPLIESTQPAERDLFLWDSRLSRFGVRVKPSGVKSFVIQYRNTQGQSKRRTLGRYGDPLTLDEARKAAERELASVTLGADPVSERDEIRRAWSVRKLAEHYLSEAEAGNVLTRRSARKSPSTLGTDRGRIYRHILPLLGSKSVRDLKRSDIQQAFAAIKVGKTAVNEKTSSLRGRAIVTGGAGTAKRTIGLLSGILTFGVELGIIEVNPAHGIRMPKDGKRTVTDPFSIYSALGRALGRAANDGEPWQAVDSIRLIALTGMRKSEAIKLRWSEVDFAGKAIRLANSKTGASVRPMSQKVINLLRAIQGRQLSGNFVFPAARITDASFGGLPRAVARIIGSDKIDLADRERLIGFSLHLLRHSAATTADGLGMSLPTIKALIGHTGASTTEGYIGRVDAVLLDAADKMANKIDKVLSETSFEADERNAFRPVDPAVIVSLQRNFKKGKQIGSAHLIHVTY